MCGGEGSISDSNFRARLAIIGRALLFVVMVIGGRVVTQIETKFERFHRENPDVYKQFAIHCYELWNSDIRQFAASSILTVIRFNYALSEHNTSLKILSAYSSRYAEKLIRDDARFSDFFK